ncbi:hypothetical protein [Sporomusa sp.]|uniref:hypothetical protein n=1 Tax=Sporomusa sp. TaxID=2078658 RepID=UPI002CB9B7A2|nr:hypothetical protein [Sporomusa sp.]HWR45285.1 hypothetical protein [Sporomusa sp.]
MSTHKFKFQMYRALQQNIPNIYADACKAADEINIPKDLRGKFGLTGAIAGCPAPLRNDREVIPLANLVDDIRELVKSVYGDEFDACPVSTCGAGLWVTFDSLFSPPMMGRGDNYRARYIAPYEKHLHHQGSYGRPFPARFKDIFGDRGTTAGELGFYGKRQNNLDTVIVPLAGARYDVHGIKYYPVPLLTGVDPEESVDILSQHASIHAPFLTGITSLGYETPGYGYAVKDKEGTPILQKYLADLAHSYDIPYVINNAWGLPFIGCNPLKNGADVIIYSMDKATGAATGGLIIGKEEYMVPIHRAMCAHGDTASYGKAALLSQIQALKILRDTPKVLTDPVDALERIVIEEFDKINLSARLKDGIMISKSYNSTAVEVNYEKTWDGDEMGIPIFSIEDMYAGSNIFQAGMAQMGIIPTVAYDGNICISPGLATVDSKNRLIEDVTRYAIKGLVRLIEITCRYAGIA